MPALSPPALAISPRVRPTPWTSRNEAAGVAAYTVYNHMLLPATFRGLEADYFHLRSTVQVWDVGCERQVELIGPQAAHLAQMLTVRDLSGFVDGRCGYAPVCDHEGRMLNDPIVLRLAADRYWFSVADSDVVLWASGIAHGAGLDVRVHEPDVWPLAVQGPRAEDAVAAVFGEGVREIGFFRFGWFKFRGHPLLVARSGWSSQGGFEIYVDDPDVGIELYDSLMHDGERFGIGPGCPNLIERIESGLLSYGTDMTRADTALEAGLERYCALDAPIAAIGLDALRRQKAAGVTRCIAGLTIAGEPLPGLREPHPVVVAGGPVGQVRSAAWSPRLGTNVALGMIAIDQTAPGCAVDVTIDDEVRRATIVAVPFPGATTR